MKQGPKITLRLESKVQLARVRKAAQRSRRSLNTFIIVAMEKEVLAIDKAIGELASDDLRTFASRI